MKQEEKSALARRRILNAAMREFADKGYEGASLNTVCAENGISKGIIYHHFRDKSELYLLCVEECFDALTAYLERERAAFGPQEQGLQDYFNARLRFFAQQPLYLGIFADAVFQPPSELAGAVAERKRGFDALSISVLTDFLADRPLRGGLSAAAIAEELRSYMDYFNLRFKTAFAMGCCPEDILKEHEERCRRQIDILLHGLLVEEHEKETDCHQ